MTCLRCKHSAEPIAAAGLSETERVLRRLGEEMWVCVGCLEPVKL